VYGHNFLKTILRLAAERESLNVVGDQYGVPTSTSLIARQLYRVLSLPQIFGPMVAAPGLYHLCPEGKTSWYDYARYIVSCSEDFGIGMKLQPEAIRSIATEDFPLPAMRLRNASLATDRFQQAFGATFDDWKQDVRACIAALAGSFPHF
jgi:dTDP-4-dehydrorhamnose reductase